MLIVHETMEHTVLYCTMNDLLDDPFSSFFSATAFLLCASVLTLIPKGIRMGYVATTTENDDISNLKRSWI